MSTTTAPQEGTETEPLPPPQEEEAARDNNNNEATTTNADDTLSIEELLYSSSSYHAIAVPVSITMILSALAVTFINTPENRAMTEQALSAAYESFDNSSGTSAQNFGFSVLNALIIVSVICAMTFLIVILYKYRCMCFLMGYMIFASATLLGFLGGVMFMVAIERYKLDIDQFSFYFTLYNFAAVGTAAIFWQKGIPKVVTQGYLVATSVILAWQLSNFDDWTAWCLLVALALYDLCAVLTPCGPLKALVNLMQRDDAPDMPGLLYEAQLPQEARRPGGRNRRSQAEAAVAAAVIPPSGASTDEPTQASTAFRDEPSSGTEGEDSVEMNEGVVAEEPVVEAGPPPTAMIPLAIAKLYRLRLTEPVEPAVRRNSFTPLLEDEEPTNPTEAIPEQQYSREQLVSDVEAIFPRGGGRIDRVVNGNGAVRYRVVDRHGVTKRMLFVEEATGRVMEERGRDDDDDDGNENTIKLGLGDFIFYSVLVSKAVQYSFTTFCACMLVILAGLGGTLVLLAVYRHALPALPISIFLGVLFYVLTRLLIEPYIEAVFQNPIYV